MRSERVQTAAKALILIAIGFFLYSRIAGGTLLFYIAERFAWLTLLAAIGFLAVGASYRLGKGRTKDEDEHHHNHGHDHGLTWGAAGLLLLPVILGVVVSPRPLGAAALASREVQVTESRSTMPAAVRAAAAKSAVEKNVLDWSQLFAASPNPGEEFAGQSVDVIGFVYRDDRFGADEFFVTRFMVSCCVADAAVAGLVVRWPDAATLPADQWVQVQGVFEAGQFAGQPSPVLAARSLRPVETPSQPYLYP
jgi:uncharacterized repeat protein (TIGR03943 family)